MFLAAGNVGLGVTLIALAVLSAFYCFGPLGRSPQAGIFVPGPLWFRRTVVGSTGAFALIAGVAELVRA
jgi:hypothetical protein